jgi:chitin disaccharide deacetylase
MPDDGRILIVNADDFGLSAGVNSGVIKAREHGIVTSASLMVRGLAAHEAASYARSHPDFSVGLHIDLGEWAWRDEDWATVYEVVPFEDAEAVAAEVQRQLEAFRVLVGTEPTHLDSHQHVHTSDPAAGILRGIAAALRVPLRHEHPDVRYCGDLYGQTRTGAPMLEAVSVPNLIDILSRLQPGITELGCHPGEGGDVESIYRFEREAEVEALCDPRVREAIESEGIVLRSFGAVPRRP